MRRCFSLLNYQRGSWCPGSKHQKHMSVNPTYFLYRFPGPKGPGPYTMKYWWTLGCFPTGMSVPFRLQEFLSTYQQSHVPVEVEEWLQYVVVDPFFSLKKEIDSLCSCIESYPELSESTRLEISSTSAHQFAAPLRKIESILGVFITPSSIVKTLKCTDLREKLLDHLTDYNELLQRSGSTPHRRFARYFFDSSAEHSVDASSNSLELVSISPSISEKLSSAIGSLVDPPSESAPDEVKIIQLLSTVAEGSSRAGLFFDAHETLYSALPFSHDSQSRSHLYSNIASSALAIGEFKEAEHFAKESLLAVQPARKKDTKKIYQLWCAAVAYQEDFAQCDTILDEALEIFADDSELHLWKEHVHTQLNKARGASSNLSKLRHRSKFTSVRSRQLLMSTGRTFDNEFCWATFKNKLYPCKMNPSTNEMGSVFRRVGDLGLHTSTSRSAEFL